MSKAPSPVTFISCLAGSVIDRTRLLASLRGAMRPGDEALVVDGNYGPPPPFSDGDLPPGMTVLRLADAPLSLAYDRLAATAAHEHLIFVGTGCDLARADMDRLRSKLSSAPGAAVLVPLRTGARVDLDARSVLGVSRQVLDAIGGMAVTEDRARRVAAGFVGSGDLFEVFIHEVRRAGWPVEQIRQNVKSRAVSDMPESRDDGDGNADLLQSPSQRIPIELRAAVGPMATTTVNWFSKFLPETQVAALRGLVGPGPGRTDSGTWDAMSVARMLWWRGQRPFAARLLEQTDLDGYVDPTAISDIVLILSSAGCPMATLVAKLAHAQAQLAAAVASHPAEQASGMFLEWWQSAPEADALFLGVQALAPTLGLEDAVDWHHRLRGVAVVASPLVSVARNVSRSPHDRAVAARCLEIDDPSFDMPELSALRTGLDAAQREAIDGHARRLLSRIGVAAVR